MLKFDKHVDWMNAWMYIFFFENQQPGRAINLHFLHFHVWKGRGNCDKDSIVFSQLMAIIYVRISLLFYRKLEVSCSSVNVYYSKL